MGTFAADIEEEVWRDVKDYEDRYEVSSSGRVRSKAYLKRTANMHGPMEFMTRPRLMKLTPNGSGYLSVDLRKDKVRNTSVVHRLVAEAFLQNHDNLPVVHHKDHDRQNNRVGNLVWTTQQDNVKCSYQDGYSCNKGDNHPRRILTASLVVEMRALYDSGITSKQLAEMYGLKYHTVDKAVRRINWSHI